MRIYESTFILSPQADDAAFDQQIKAITDLIGNNDGKIIQEDRWGIRRLAYPIQKFTQGYYTRLVFEGNNKVLTELERFYKLEEPYIRYLTVLFEGEPHEKIVSDAIQSSDTIPVKKPVQENTNPAPATETTESKKPENVEPATTEVKTEEPEVEVPAEEKPVKKPRKRRVTKKKEEPVAEETPAEEPKTE